MMETWFFHSFHISDIQTQDRPLVVLSIDMEHHTIIHNFPFSCLWSDPITKSFPEIPHTPGNAQLHDAVMV